MTKLGTLQELPDDFLVNLSNTSLTPLWPSLRSFLPYQQPNNRTQPYLWAYKDLRPLLLESGTLTPVEKAERRVLVLSNPSLGKDSMMATPTLYVGMQLILPGETAPNHRHTPAAIRLMVEGAGAYTVVDGERCKMDPGDLVLTPPGMWHEHGHDGESPGIWLDGLDLPIIHYMEASFSEESSTLASINSSNNSETHYLRSGLLPANQTYSVERQNYPLLRFPWKDTKLALDRYEATVPMGKEAKLNYVNPLNGQPCLKSMGCSVFKLRPKEQLLLPRRSSSSVLHVIEGDGTVFINDKPIAWSVGDTVAVPSHQKVAFENSSNSPASLFCLDDAPMQRYLQIYKEY